MAENQSDPSFFEHFFTNANDLFSVSGIDGYFKYLSPRWSEALGYSLEEMFATPILTLIHPDDIEQTLKMDVRQFTQWRTSFFENRYRHKDGSYRVLQWSIFFHEPKKLFYGVARDITDEKRRNEERVRRVQERFELIAESSGDVLWDYDLQDPNDPLAPAQSLFFSRQLPKMLGYEEAEFPAEIGSWMRYIHPDDLPAVDAAVREYLARRARRYWMEYRMIRKDGEVLWIEATGLAKWDEQGRPVRFAGSMRDISERKRSEAELQEKLQIIAEQRDAIRNLSIPIIHVWQGVLVLPIVGALDSDRAAEMMERLLGSVTQHRSRYAILDLTGVEVVDTSTAGHLFRVISAVGLLGAKSIVTGIRPQVAQTMAMLGQDLTKLDTAATLEQALRRCMSDLGEARRGVG